MKNAKTLVELFAVYPYETVAALAVLACIFLAIEVRRVHRESLKLAITIAPIAAKLAEGVTALERILDRTIPSKEPNQ